ncbi:MAG: hypothetical protein GZ091_05875 [Paludibacter sp.]|nr:hypothetical protein [Paludibacter sp.]
MIKKIFGAFLILLFISPLLMFFLWAFTPKKKINVLILDKTVLTSRGQEHISFSWILKHDNYVHSKKGAYKSDTDYFGFFPNDSGAYKIKDFNQQSISSLDSLANTYDMVYYTDLYGIYEGEWHEQYPEVDKINGVDNSLEHTRKIYGGMTSSELYLLKKMKVQRKLILTEFNLIASPTTTEVKSDFENEFNMKWSGWVGRYYETLDTTVNKELPRWMKKNYLDQHQNIWPYKKSGIVFVRSDDRIEILEDSTHLSYDLPVIYTSEKYMRKYGLPSEMKFPFWFDIISTEKENDIVSKYKLSPNSTGRKLLKEYGIPEIFPAVIEHDSTDYKFHYFAGDFCDSPIGLNSAKFKWIEVFSGFSYRNDAQERISFFWDYYRPMVRRIMRDYYKNDLQKK